MTYPRKSLPAGRARLAAVISEAQDVVRIADAARTLDMPRDQAARLLARWAGQGWLRRVGTGAYVPVSLQLLDAEQVLEDPWILVPVLFGPAYVGGRTAAEHWGLTEQIFRDIVVFTTRPVRAKTLERGSTVFTLKHTSEENIFGVSTIWRGQTRVTVSDIHRSIVDMLDDPAVGGGIQHVADCLNHYLERKDSDVSRLIAYADRLGNGAVFKRLGFLAERHSRGAPLVEEAKKRLTQGHARLDPALDCRRLVTRWRLRVPETWIRKSA